MDHILLQEFLLLFWSAVAMSQQADYLCPGIMDAPKWRDPGFDFGLHVLYRAEITTLEVGGLDLVRLEEIAQFPEKLLRRCLLFAEEDIKSYIAKGCIGMDGEMAFLEQKEHCIMISIHDTGFHL